MELRRCDYCGTEYNVTLAQCPLCGKPADPNAEVDETAPAHEAVAVRKNAARSRIPAGLWISSFAVLAVAVLAGAVYFLYAMGLFTSDEQTGLHTSEQSQTQEQTDPVEQEDPEVEPPVDTGACTDLTLSQEAVTLEEKGGYFFLTVLAEPSDCTEPISYECSDEQVVTVSGNGSSCMITAEGPGTAEVIVTCGEIVKVCEITCDFEEVVPPEEEDVPADPDAEQDPDAEREPDAEQDPEDEQNPEENQPAEPDQPAVQPSLSSVDFTLFTPGEQYTLLVNDAPAGAAITFTSSDSKVVTITEKGLVTAVGSGSSILTVKVNDITLTCVARCNLTSSAETGNGQPDAGDPNAVYTISHVDVTLNPTDKTFRLTLIDENGKAVEGETWVSTKTGVCTVDANGTVTAVATGTADVQTTYGGKTYTCIVRCYM